MIQAVGNFCDWLAATPISQLFQNVFWIIPMVQSVHIMSVAIVVGSMVMIDLKLLRLVGGGDTVSDQLNRFGPWVRWALVVLLGTGSILTCAEPRRELLNLVFLTKMALILGTVIGATVFEATVRAHADAWGDRPSNPMAARVLAVTSLLVVIAIVVCGRWIAYVSHG